MSDCGFVQCVLNIPPSGARTMLFAALQAGTAAATPRPPHLERQREGSASPASTVRRAPTPLCPATLAPTVRPQA